MEKCREPKSWKEVNRIPWHFMSSAPHGPYALLQPFELAQQIFPLDVEFTEPALGIWAWALWEAHQLTTRSTSTAFPMPQS